MKIGNKKLILSKGLAFYAELESRRLANELSEGWEIEQINWFGFYKLKPVAREKAEMTIDFYSGKKSEIPEYLEIYKAAGWEEVTRYRNRYFVFKAPLGKESIYTDEQSYIYRIKKEHSWVFLNSFIPFFIGLLIFLILKIPLIVTFLNNYLVLSLSIKFLLLFLIMFPLACVLSILYFKFTYLKRSTYFKHPKNYALKQRFKRDLVLSLLMGGIVGGCIGFMFETINLF